MKAFTRRALFLRPDLVLIHDELAADQPRRFDHVLRRYENAFELDGDAIVSKGNNHRGQVAVQVLAPAKGELLAENFRSTVRSGLPTLHGIKLHPKTPAATARFVTLLYPLAEGQKRLRSELLESTSGLTVTINTSNGTKLWTVTLPADPKASAKVTASGHASRP